MFDGIKEYRVMKKKSLFCVLSLLIVCSVSHADLIMSIVADDTALAVGESTTLHVWGIADEAVVDNGLYDWSVSAVVDATGVVQVTSASALQPIPIDPGSVIISQNVGGLGNVDASAAIQFAATESNAGVALTELFNFDVEAVAVGDVQYSLTNIIGDLFDFTVNYDAGSENVQFSGPGPFISVVAVPEPATLILLGLGSLVACRRKK